MLYNVQALRALAATMVVFYHMDFLFAIFGLPAFGGEGVDLFFIISGFIMVNTTNRTPQTPWRFFENRISRIVPLYWAMTILLFILSIFFSTFLKSTIANVVYLIKSLFFIPFIKGGGPIRPLLFVGWTLNYEMVFYALFSLGLFLKSPLLRVGLISAALVSAVLYGRALHPQGAIARFYTDPIILEFGIGMILGLTYDRMPSRGSRFQIALIISILLVTMFVLFLDPALITINSRIVRYALPAALVVSCALILERWGVNVRARFVMAIGNASYAIYLAHTFITQSALMLFNHVHHGPLMAIGFIVATLATVLALGRALNVWVEKPLVDWTRSWLSRVRFAH